MRVLPAIKAIAMSGDHTGDRRPIARVTVQKYDMQLHAFNLQTAYTILASNGVPTSMLNPVYDTKHGRKIRNVYADGIFGSTHNPKEIPYVKSVVINRSLDTPVATATITILNNQSVAGLPIAKTLNQPGYFTPLRGLSPYSASWGHAANEWAGMFLPDNIVRTYEGYGCTPSVAPEKDTKLAITGTWLILKTSIDPSTHDLVLSCADLGKLCEYHKVVRPIVPPDFYPLSFQNWDGKVNIGNTTPGRSRISVKLDDTSNTTWIGAPPAAVSGHAPAHALDGNPSTYWLSIGNDLPSRKFAYEWVQVKMDKATVSEVRVRSVRKGYTAYVSVMVNGSWQGAHTINYDEVGIGHNGADIPYVATKKVTSENDTVITFPAIKNATKVRVTFGNLQWFNNGPYHYRAAMREIAVYGVAGSATPNYSVLTPGPEGSNPGRYQDWTNVVKLLLAWAGFFWPQGSSLRNSDATVTPADFAQDDDAVLGAGVNGRVWGDFENAGTSGPAPVQGATWDKKSILECIQFVQSILGYTFFFDETGGAQWRLSNVYDVGNYITLSKTAGGRTGALHRLDEISNLTGYRPELSSEDVREAIVVSDQLGTAAKTSSVRGFNPNPTGIRRIATVCDAFSSRQETTVYGELAAIRAMFNYRTATSTISGDPSIQLDDQARVLERESSDGYVHRITGISSTLDMVNGTYDMDLTHHWLGVDPSSKWIIPPNLEGLSEETKAYINNLVGAADLMPRRVGVPDA